MLPPLEANFLTLLLDKLVRPLVLPFGVAMPDLRALPEVLLRARLVTMGFPEPTLRPLGSGRRVQRTSTSSAVNLVEMVLIVMSSETADTGEIGAG